MNLRNFAGPWLRLLARIIDVLVFFLILELMINWVVSSCQIETLLNRLLANLIFGLIFLPLIIPFFNSLLISQLGGTFGKLLSGIKIIDDKSENIGFLKAFFRTYVGYTVSGVLFGLGFIWVFVDKQKRGWHDLVSGSWVVVKNKRGAFLALLFFLLLITANFFLITTIYLRFKQNKPFFNSLIKDITGEIKKVEPPLEISFCSSRTGWTYSALG